MTKALAIVVVLASFLLVAPVLESGSLNSVVFQAVGNAEDGGGGE
jgi:hypothetical protein